MNIHTENVAKNLEGSKNRAEIEDLTRKFKGLTLDPKKYTLIDKQEFLLEDILDSKKKKKYSGALILFESSLLICSIKKQWVFNFFLNFFLF